MSNHTLNFKHAEAYILEMQDDRTSVTIDVLAMYEGKHTDSEGVDLEITAEMLDAIHHNYNKLLEEPENKAMKAIRMVSGKKHRPRYKNLTLNHNKSDVREIVGKVTSLEVRKVDGLSFLFAKLQVIKKENVDNVIWTDTIPPLWDEVSISFDYDLEEGTASLNEISYVFEGAVAHARSFSKENEPKVLQSNKKHVEFERCKSELEKYTGEKKRIDTQIKELEAKKNVVISFEKMVEGGDISRRDFKRLMVDLELAKTASFDEVLVRAVKTVAKSRKQLRGAINSDFSAQAFSSFVDNVQTVTKNNGDKGMMSPTAEEIEKKTKEFAKNIREGKPGNSSFEKAPEDKREAKKDEDKAEKEAGFSKEDADRMYSMMSEGKTHKEMMDYMESVGYKKKEDGEKTHDHSAPDANQASDFSKQVQAINEDIAALKASNATVEASLLTIANSLVELSKKS